ncbi:MAG: hypothetical protein HQ526_10560, partial [Actinobacteria bacterium]|nr:hypothetical protein [Actinomycetota bacterium]
MGTPSIERSNYARGEGRMASGNAKRRPRRASGVPATERQLRGRLSSAGRNDLRATTIQDLLTDPTDRVRATIAANESVSVTVVLAELRDDRSPQVRASLVTRSDSPRKELQAAAIDQAPEVRAAVATNALTPAALTWEELWVLANDDHVPTREALAALESIPADIATHLAEDTMASVRMQTVKTHAGRVRLNPLRLAQWVGLIGPEAAVKGWGLPPRPSWPRIVSHSKPGAPVLSQIAILAKGSDLINGMVESPDPTVRAAVLFNTRVRDA